MIRIAVCEPDHGEAGRMEELLAKAGSFVPEEVRWETYASGDDFLAALERGEAFELVFLNLSMGDTDGLSLGRRLRKRFSSRDTLIILLSAFSHLSERLFDIQPFSLLRTPVGEKAFLQKCLAALAHLRQSDDHFLYKKGRVVEQVKKQNVICLESSGRNIILSIRNREDVEYREALKNVQEKFREVNFLRPHVSYIVNLDCVEQYRSDSLLLCNQKRIPISELRLREVRAAVLRYWEYRNLL